MPAQIGLKLRETVKSHGIDTAKAVFREALDQKKVTVEDLSFREMAEHMIGSDWAAKLRTCTGATRLQESIAAVDASGFSAITGQLLVDTVREKYKLATFVGNELFTTVKITNGNLQTQREPYLSDTTDEPGVVNQGQPYSQTAFVGQYVDYPAPAKYGRICSVTFEAIFSDLTGQILDSAGSVGRRVGLYEEKAKLRVAFGLVNNHSWNGTSYNTYLTSGAWTNAQETFTLTDWTSLNTIEQLFNGMVDPVLLEPIDIGSMNLFVMPANYYTAKRILNATEVLSGNITSGAGHQIVSQSPLEGYGKLMTSKHARKVLVDSGLTTEQADAYGLMGDFKKAFVWREVFPMQVVQAPPQNAAEFNQDIVLQVKANIFGVAGVRDPRQVIRFKNT
jgi:hypothetical protein